MKLMFLILILLVALLTGCSQNSSIELIHKYDAIDDEWFEFKDIYETYSFSPFEPIIITYQSTDSQRYLMANITCEKEENVKDQMRDVDKVIQRTGSNNIISETKNEPSFQKTSGKYSVNNSNYKKIDDENYMYEFKTNDENVMYILLTIEENSYVKTQISKNSFEGDGCSFETLSKVVSTQKSTE